MIDFEKLDQAYHEDRFYSLQLEVGDRCQQGCIYCYMNAVEEGKNQLTDSMIYKLLEDSRALGINAIEWLGGEPLLRPGIFSFMEKSRDLGFRNNMWTGGLPFKDKGLAKKTAALCRHGLISIHLSTINPSLYKNMHPERSPEDIDLILDGIGYLLEIGYPSEQLINSVTYTGLQGSDDLIATMQYFFEEFGIQTSINVYHTYLRPGTSPGELQKFIPAPEEVSRVYHYYKKMIKVKELPMNCVNKQYCSATLAVINNGFVTPCATIREEVPAMDLRNHSFKHIVNANKHILGFNHFKKPENRPDGCRNCKINEECWGCRSRSYAIGKGLFGIDPRCFRNPGGGKFRQHTGVNPSF